MHNSDLPSAITLRNLPVEVAEAIQARAARDGASFNKTVIRLLQESLGAGRRKRLESNGLERFVGSWSDAEADRFDENLAEVRKVDAERWE